MVIEELQIARCYPIPMPKSNLYGPHLLWHLQNPLKKITLWCTTAIYIKYAVSVLLQSVEKLQRNGGLHIVASYLCWRVSLFGPPSNMVLADYFWRNKKHGAQLQYISSILYKFHFNPFSGNRGVADCIMLPYTYDVVYPFFGPHQTWSLQTLIGKNKWCKTTIYIKYVV